MGAAAIQKGVEVAGFIEKGLCRLKKGASLPEFWPDPGIESGKPGGWALFRDINDIDPRIWVNLGRPGAAVCLFVYSISPGPRPIGWMRA
jgi:hypothetical protein